MRYVIQSVLAVLGGGLGWLLGGLDGFVYALIAVVVLDYLTAVMLAIVERKLSSDIGFRGIFKKVCIFIIIAVAHIACTHVLGYDSAAIRTAVIFFYIANEGISVLENVCELGLPVPSKLRMVLEKIQNKGEQP
jgi:toxin secretion/phage lysis holin